MSLSSALAKGILTAELAAPLRRRDRHPHVDPKVLALAQPLFQTPAFKKRTHSRIASEITCESAAQTQLDSGEVQHSSGAVVNAGHTAIFGIPSLSGQNDHRHGPFFRSFSISATVFLQFQISSVEILVPQLQLFPPWTNFC